MSRVRTRVWEVLEAAKPGDRLSRLFDISILTLIFLNVGAVVVGTVGAVADRWGNVLWWFELFSVTVFTGEYVGRVWSCTAGPSCHGAIRGRLEFMARPMSIIDVLAVLPFYLPFFGADLRILRALRLFRIVRIAKVGRYYSSLSLIKRVFASKKEELVLTTFLMLMLLVISGSVMYYCEHDDQPDAFPNIPATLWWAVATLTTVGYGDIYPITIVGKVMGSVIAVLGIGMFALPTGILGAGFVEAIQERKSGVRRCPHCGKSLHGNPQDQERATPVRAR
jgi:voltage-gated potassium channel